MKQGITLQALALEVQRQNDSKRDFVLPPALMNMSYVESEKMLSVSLPLKGGERQMFGLTRTAHDQLGEYLDIPTPYYRRMETQAPGLLATNVNRWLGDRKEEKDTRLVRCLDGNVRGVLSGRYRCLDNFDLAKVVLPILQEHDFSIQDGSCNIDEKSMRIKVISKSVKADIRPNQHTPANDVLAFGLSFSNSEIGFGTLNIEELLWKLSCRNGLISESMVNRRHVGSKNNASDGSWELFSDETKRLSDAAFWNQVRDVVRAAVKSAKERFDKLVAKVNGAAQEAIKNPTEAVEVVKEKYGLSDQDGGGILAHLAKGGDMSVWGLVNAVTAYAQDDSLSYEQATEFEKLGGKLLGAKANAFEKRELVAA